MNKIPTLFKRDDHFKVLDVINPECQWVIDGEGIATEKVDGTNVRLTLRNNTVVRVEKRRNPTRAQKEDGIVNPWYVDAHRDDPADKWLFEAALKILSHGFSAATPSVLPDGEYCCEALGPKIQGNPLDLRDHCCIPFDYYKLMRNGVSRTYYGLLDYLDTATSILAHDRPIEGIVWHHPDGRRAKIKRKDFPRGDRR